MKFLLPLIALFATFCPIPTSGVLYVGVFYDPILKHETLKPRFYSTDVIGTADNSSLAPAYDHITLHFRPNETMLTNVYNARFGDIQTAHVLGYAMDEHGQALLVSVDGPNAIQSTNTFPHVTISSSGKSPYTAVYSNDLWARVASSGFVKITNDKYNKPKTIKWNDQNPAFKQATLVRSVGSSKTYEFTLPEFKGEFSGSGTYAPTTAHVTLYEPSIGGLLRGTFCADTKWNFETGVCDVPRYRTISFSITVKGTTDANDIAGQMRIVAEAAKIPTSAYIINNDHIVRVGYSNWKIKMGFRSLSNGQDTSKIFEAKLKEMCPKARTSSAAGSSRLSGIVMEEADVESIIYGNEMYLTQTCADGTTLSADQQCAASAATSTESSMMTSSSSIPIVTIVAPIMGGIVLIALIATVIIIRRRRPNNTVKSMEGIAPPVAVTATDRV